MTQLEIIKNSLNSDAVLQKFKEILGENAKSFLTSVIQITSQNEMLKNADHNSILQAAMQAAIMGLPINPNLGFSYIIPYRQGDTVVAQFQVGYKGFIQLAQRTGQYKAISVSEIYEGQLIVNNPLTGAIFNFSVPKNHEVIGYAAYILLQNGFEKTLYMSAEEMESHGQKFSKTFNSSSSLWKKEKVGMGKKTVLKMLLTKYCPLSIEMQRAVLSDQSIVVDAESGQYEYSDNPTSKLNKPNLQTQTALKENARIIEQVKAAQTKEKLGEIQRYLAQKDLLTDDFTLLINNRVNEINNANQLG